MLANSEELFKVSIDVGNGGTKQVTKVDSHSAKTATAAILSSA